MRSFLRKSALLLVLMLGISGIGFSQFGSFNYFQPVTAANPTGADQYNYQIRLIVNTQSLISGGKLESDGRDLRFGDDCGVQNYAYWIEDYLNTDTTVIWVRLDSILSGATLNFSMFYGDSTASPVSSFSATFPNAIITNGSNAVITPGVDVRWIEVGTGDTLFMAPGVVNDLHARYVDIDGVIWGLGAGFQNPPNSNNGNGPGGGVWGTSSGAGGGGYGGAGGVGGYDSGDPINAGGVVYGTTTGPDIDMGSTGGSASTVVAGDGGGALRLAAEWLTVSGQINCDGGLAQQPGGGQGAGGGAGGGILLHGEYLTFSGNLSARGNGGSIGTSTANDDGGGGGGGRIKLFYESSISNTGAMAVNGGPGGVNGSAGTGAPGSVGTTHMDTMTFHVVSGTLAAEQVNSAAPPPIISAPAQVCEGDSATIMVSGPYSNFTFASGGSTLQSGTDSTYSFPVTSAQTIVVTSVGSCTYEDTVVVDALTPPTPSITTPAGPYCSGMPVNLSVASGYASVTWSTGGSGDSIAVSATGSYSVEVSDSAGCTGTDTVNMTFLASPNPAITASGGTNYCEGDTAVLSITSGLPNVMWSTGDTGNSISVTASAMIYVTSTDTNGCMGSDTIDIQVNPNPVPMINVAGNTLSTMMPYATYQWLLNGSAISGATNATYDALSTGDYSVTVTDSNGCTGTSDTTFVLVGMESAFGPGAVTVAPNPFRGSIRISANIPVSGSLDLEIMNVNGSVVFRRTEKVTSGTWNSEIRTDELPAGIYLLKLKTETGVSVSRIVKQ